MAMILDSLKDIETPPIQQIKKFFPFEIKNSPLAVNEGDIPAKSPILNLDPQKLIEDHEKYTQKIEQEELRDLQLMLEDILNNPNKFQEVNNLVKMGPYSPFSKAEVNKSEKYIEGAENIVKKWVKQLEEMNKNCLAYTKSIETFGTQLLMDKSFFKDNIELQTLLTLIAQVLKEHAIYIEVFTQVVQDSIEK